MQDNKNEIICPNCKKVFKIDEAGFADIVRQVRDHKFEEEVGSRIKGAVNQAVAEQKADYETKIVELKAKINSFDTEKELAVTKAVGAVIKERDELKVELLNEKGNLRFQEKNFKEEIERLKDMKAKMSTKMVGESLEQHCEMEFEKVRALAFSEAKFCKDNKVSTQSGSKGDYIYRDYEDGLEFTSIMFEMKNENDTTATKKKNEDFLKELDKDRDEKGCEYAVLVSLLEADSELYNQGIVDLSHKYPKMYVIRPQFFVPMITLIRNSAKASLNDKKELAIIKAQNIDIENFEKELNAFKTAFARNYSLASGQFGDAIRGIDDTIKKLEKIKELFMKTENNLRLANDKLEDVSVKKLTRKNPTMRAKFEELG